MKRTSPSEVEQRVLRILAVGERPLKSKDLIAGSGLSANEVQSACAWLRENQFVSRQLRRVKQQAWDARGYKSLAFWSLTGKGLAYVAARSDLPMAAE